MRRLVRAALCVLAVLAPALARAGADAPDEFDADRPDVSESPLALTTGRWQIEAGSTFEPARDHESDAGVGEALLRWGVARSLELRGTLPTWFRRSFDTATAGGAGVVSGFGDAGVGFKATLPRSLDGWAAGVVFDLGLPTGSRAFGAGAAGFEAEVAAARALGDDDLELNGLWYHESDQDVLGLSESFGLGLGRSLGAYVEGVETARTDAAALDAPRTTGLLLDGGATWRAARWTQLDAHVGVGRIAGDETRLAMGLGVAKRW